MHNIVETMARFVRAKKCETSVGFPTIPVQNIVEAMVDLLEEKKCETSVGFPTIPVQNIVETMARFVRGKKVWNNGWTSNNRSANNF